MVRNAAGCRPMEPEPDAGHVRWCATSCSYPSSPRRASARGFAWCSPGRRSWLTCTVPRTGGSVQQSYMVKLLTHAWLHRFEQMQLLIRVLYENCYWHSSLLCMYTGQAKKNGRNKVCLFAWFLTTLSALIGYNRAIGVWCISRRAARQHKYHAIRRWKNTINQHDHKLSSAWALWRWSVATVRLPHRGLSSQSLGK